MDYLFLRRFLSLFGTAALVVKTGPNGSSQAWPFSMEKASDGAGGPEAQGLRVLTCHEDRSGGVLATGQELDLFPESSWHLERSHRRWCEAVESKMVKSPGSSS